MAPVPGEQTRFFQASPIFVALFYGALLLWTVATIPPIWIKFQRGGFAGDKMFAVMIAFFYGYTWYWVLGIFYSISLDPDGRVVMKSVRRSLAVPAAQVGGIEGSRFPGGFGFVRIRLPRESGYLFCQGRNPALDEIFAGIRKINPRVKSVRI